MWSRTGGQARNGIRRCLNRRNNTMWRVSHRPVPGRGVRWTYHALFGRTVRINHGVILGYHRRITAKRGIWRAIGRVQGETGGESVGLPTKRVPIVDRNPSCPATSVMASEQNQLASSSTRPPLRSTASKRAPDESRSVSSHGPARTHPWSPQSSAFAIPRQQQLVLSFARPRLG